MQFTTEAEAQAFAAARDLALKFPKVTTLGEFPTAAPITKAGKSWSTPACAADLRANGYHALTEVQPDGAAEDWKPRVWELDDDATLPAHSKAADDAKAVREATLLAMAPEDVLASLAPTEPPPEPEDPLVLTLAKAQDVSLDVAREVAAKVRASEAAKVAEQARLDEQLDAKKAILEAGD